MSLSKKLRIELLIRKNRFDPFHIGLSKYTFREQCDEEPGLTLCDGTVKIIYNCCYEGEDISDDLKKLMIM